MKAPQLPSRGSDNVLEDGALGEENHSSTQIQERVKEKEVTKQKPQSEVERITLTRKLDYNFEPNGAEELDTRVKSQNYKWSQLPHGQSTLDDEISGGLDNGAKYKNGLNKLQEKDRKQEAPPLEEKLSTEVEDNECQHLLVQGGVEGSLRRRTTDKPFSTSRVESSDNPEPSKGSFGSFWERLLQWFYSFFARLFGSGSP